MSVFVLRTKDQNGQRAWQHLKDIKYYLKTGSKIRIKIFIDIMTIVPAQSLEQHCQCFQIESPHLTQIHGPIVRDSYGIFKKGNFDQK